MNSPAAWVLASWLACASVHAQEDLLRELVERPAPAADWREQERAWEQRLPAGQRRGAHGEPGPEASLEVLAAYWGEVSTRRIEPSPVVRARLMAACERDPGSAPRLLRWLPDVADTCARLKKLLDEDAQAPRFDADWREALHEWLKVRSRYFLEDLAAEAARFNGVSGVGREALCALARLDAEKAEPMLREFAAGKDPRSRALALGLLRDRAIAAGQEAEADSLRKELQAILEDAEAPGWARDNAFEALARSAGPDRDAWVLACFRLPGIVEFRDMGTVFHPLNAVVREDPDHWIPLVAARVGDKDRGVHDAAVGCLIQFHLEDARADALKPLLPWLADPAWSSAPDRLRLIQSLDRVDLPESVPGLIEVAKTARGYELSGAAESLAKYRDPRAIDVLRAAVGREPEEHHRNRLIVALSACGGLDDDKSFAAIVAFVRSESAGEESGEDPIDVAIGAALAGSQEISDPLAERLAQQARTLEADRPAAATRLLGIANGASGRATDLRVLRRIAERAADADEVAAVLCRRDALRGHAGAELRAMLRGPGAPCGIAAVLLHDPEAESAVLAGADAEAKRALLACARLVRDPLPVDRVAPLLAAEDAGLARAAENYLEAEDGSEARRLLLQRRRGAVRILGARMDFDPGHSTYTAFDRWEDLLRRELEAGSGPDEVFALLSAGYWGDQGQILVRRRGARATLSRVEGEVRFFRDLSEAELAGLRSFVETNAVDELPPLDIMVMDGIQMEYLHLTRDGGRRVFMNNPGDSDSAGTRYDLLRRRFEELARAPGMQERLLVQDWVEDVAILVSDEWLAALTVVSEGAEWRVLVRDRRTEQTSWRRFTEGRLQDEVAPPSIVPNWRIASDAPEEMGLPQHLNRHAWQVAVGGGFLRCGRYQDLEGLWICRPGEKPDLLFSGTWGFPLVSPDGKWAVAAFASGSWANPNGVFRVDLTTRERQRVDLPPADTFDPVAYVPAHGKFLLRRAKDEPGAEGEGPDDPEYWLLDAATDECERATGEFVPWFDQTLRPLQPTGNADEVWAARRDGDRGVTVIGRYDTRKFVFVPRAEFPALTFSSMEMWVDEAAGCAYVAATGRLLRLPFTAGESK